MKQKAIALYREKKSLQRLKRLGFCFIFFFISRRCATKYIFKCILVVCIFFSVSNLQFQSLECRYLKFYAYKIYNAIFSRLHYVLSVFLFYISPVSNIYNLIRAYFEIRQFDLPIKCNNRIK